MNRGIMNCYDQWVTAPQEVIEAQGGDGIDKGKTLHMLERRPCSTSADDRDGAWAMDLGGGRGSTAM
jgi:hypothetical protein